MRVLYLGMYILLVSLETAAMAEHPCANRFQSRLRQLNLSQADQTAEGVYSRADIGFRATLNSTDQWNVVQSEAGWTVETNFAQKKCKADYLVITADLLGGSKRAVTLKKSDCKDLSRLSSRLSKKNAQIKKNSKNTERLRNQAMNQRLAGSGLTQAIGVSVADQAYQDQLTWNQQTREEYESLLKKQETLVRKLNLPTDNEVKNKAISMNVEAACNFSFDRQMNDEASSEPAAEKPKAAPEAGSIH